MGCQHGKDVIICRDHIGKQEWNTNTNPDHTNFQPFPLDNPIHISQVVRRGRRPLEATRNLDMSRHEDWKDRWAREDCFEPNPPPPVKDEFDNYPEEDVLSDDEFCFEPHHE
jgi:hypothetical protein